MNALVALLLALAGLVVLVGLLATVLVVWLVWPALVWLWTFFVGPPARRLRQWLAVWRGLAWLLVGCVRR